MHAAENYDIGIGFGRHLRERKGISRKISHVLNLRQLIIMREYHGVFFFFELFYLFRYFAIVFHLSLNPLISLIKLLYHIEPYI